MRRNADQNRIAGRRPLLDPWIEIIEHKIASIAA
jgi:hypothetical protein